MKKREAPKKSAGVAETATAPYADAVARVSVREAKDNFSSLLERAAAGEEIVITSDGLPKAMLVRFRDRVSAPPYHVDRAWLFSQPVTPDSTSAIRAERDANA